MGETDVQTQIEQVKGFIDTANRNLQTMSEQIDALADSTTKALHKMEERIMGVENLEVDLDHLAGREGMTLTPEAICPGKRDEEAEEAVFFDLCDAAKKLDKDISHVISKQEWIRQAFADQYAHIYAIGWDETRGTKQTNEMMTRFIVKLFGNLITLCILSGIDPNALIKAWEKE